MNMPESQCLRETCIKPYRNLAQPRRPKPPAPCMPFATRPDNTYNSLHRRQGCPAESPYRRRGSAAASTRICVDILIVNSDREVEKQVKTLLERQGHDVRLSPSIPEALSLLEARPAALLIIECRLLAQNGSALFHALCRHPQPPVILPTVSHLGGDRSPSALTAEVERVQDALAQAQRLLTQPQGDMLRVGDLAIDTARKRVLFHGQPVMLPPIQFRLLAHLAQNAGRVVDARELLKAVWGYEGEETEARELVKVHVRQIRRRLGLGAQSNDYIQSVRGFGYVLTGPSQP